MRLPDGRITAYALLALFCLFLFGPGLASLPPLDRDEARFAQASKQMVESGDYVRLRFQEEARNKKPVGIYWLQAGSARLATSLGLADSDAIWPYRLPSLAGATLAVLLTFGLGQRYFGREVAFLGAALTAAALQMVVEAHLAKTDAMLLAATVAAQGTLGWFYLAARNGDRVPGRRAALLFWGAQGAGILLKGPILPVISLLTIVTLMVADRESHPRWSQRPAWLKGLRVVSGLPLTLAIVVPWLVAVSKVTDGGFIGEAVRHDLLPKLMGSQESHGGPPGYYLGLFSLSYWPASLFGWLGVGWALARRREEPAERFLLAWALPAWVMFELVPTKLPHYVLPSWPAIALLGAAWIAAGLRPGRVGSLILGLWVLVGLALAVGIVEARLWLDGTLAPLSFLSAGAAVAVAVIGFWRVRRGRALKAAPVLVAGAMLVFVPVMGEILPASSAFWVSRTLSEAVHRHQAAGSMVPVAAAGYSEPSLVFLLGTHTLLTSGSGAAHHLAENAGALAVVASGEEATFLREAAADGLEVEALERIDGFNYSKGKRMNLVLYGRHEQ